MQLHSSPSLYPPAVLIALYLLPTALAFNFSAYPGCAQPYLTAAEPAACNLSSLFDTNECLCHDTTFLTTSAEAIGANCGCGDLTASANMAVLLCDNTVGSINLNASDFVAAGNVCGASGSGSGSDASRGLSAGAIAGISIAGVVFAAVSAAVAVYVCIWGRNEKEKEKSSSVAADRKAVEA